MNERHNGWSNYETWLCMVWLNESGEAEYFANYAQEKLSSGDDLDHAINCVAGDISLSFAERAEEQLGETGFLVDLMNSALREVNYREIASAIVRDLTPANQQ